MKNRALLTILFCTSAAGGWVGALLFHRPGPRAYAGTLPRKSGAEIQTTSIPNTPEIPLQVFHAETCPAEAAPREIAKVDTKEPEKSGPPKTEPKPAPVVVAPAPPPSLHLRGRIVSNMDVEIKCKVGGQIATLPFDVGDEVKKGQLLLELDTSEEERATKRAQITLSSSETRLAQARENLTIAEQALVVSRAKYTAQLKSSQVRADRARIHAERMKQTLRKNFTSQEEYDDAAAEAAVAEATLDVTRAHADELTTQEAALELKRQDVKLAEQQVEMDKLALTTAQQRIQETKVFSPIDGLITGRYVQAGNVVASGMSMQGTRILTVSDMTQMWVLAPVDLANIGKVRCGKVLSIRSEAYPGEIFQGRVARIAPRGVAGPGGVSFEVKIEVLDDPKGRLKPEMPVELTTTIAGS